MAWLPKCEELERVVGGRNWLDMMIVYFDEYAMAFVQELQSVAGESVPAKTAVFLKQMMNKEGSRECQLADLVTEAREMVREIELFVGKLMRDARS
ncbi:hypothetical protein Tco_0553494 [Tanacetum coccineum]